MLHVADIQTFYSNSQILINLAHDDKSFLSSFFFDLLVLLLLLLEVHFRFLERQR